MQTVKSVINIVLNICLALAGICFLLLLMLAPARVKVYVVQAGADEQTIQTGSLCFVDTEADLEEIKEGDIIALKAGDNAAVTHRVARAENGLVEISGEMNDRNGGTFTVADNFLGKTLFSIPYAGYVLRLVQGLQIPVLSIMVVIFSLLLIYRGRLSEG